MKESPGDGCANKKARADSGAGLYFTQTFDCY
jgi:hypothetical protein